MTDQQALDLEKRLEEAIPGTKFHTWRFELTIEEAEFVLSLLTEYNFSRPG